MLSVDLTVAPIQRREGVFANMSYAFHRYGDLSIMRMMRLRAVAYATDIKRSKAVRSLNNSALGP